MEIVFYFFISLLSTIFPDVGSTNEYVCYLPVHSQSCWFLPKVGGGPRSHQALATIVTAESLWPYFDTTFQLFLYMILNFFYLAMVLIYGLKNGHMCTTDKHKLALTTCIHAPSFENICDLVYVCMNWCACMCA